MSRGCPKGVINGPCGGYRGKKCELGDRDCPFIKSYAKLSADELNNVFSSIVLDTRFRIREYVPVPPRRPTTRFMQSVVNGEKLIIYEVFAKVTKDLGTLLNRIEHICHYAALAITDSPLGTLTYDPLALALLIKSRVEPPDVILNLAVRNKLLDELVKYVLTALASGVRNFLLVSGDWPFKGISRPFYDLDVVRTAYLLRLVMDLGIDCLGRAVTVPQPGHLGGVINEYSSYTVLEVMRNRRKELAGIEFFIPQPIYDPAFAREFLITVRKYGIRSPIIPSYAPILSKKHLELLKELGITRVCSELKNAIESSDVDRVLKVNQETLVRIMETLNTNVVYISTYGNLDSALEFIKYLHNAL